LAEQMIRLAGKEPDRDIAIVYTGLRDGEKLFEELFHEHELYDETAHEKIFLARQRDIDSQALMTLFARMRQSVLRFDEPTLEAILRELVPELVQAIAHEVAAIRRVS